MLKAFGKKAQLDTFIVGFLVFLLLIVVVGAFLIFSISLSKLKHSTQLISSGSFGSSNPLLQQAEFSLGGESQKTLVADALISLNPDKVDPFTAGKFEGVLKQIVTADKLCLAFAYSDSAKPSKRSESTLERLDSAPPDYIQIFLQYKNGNVESYLFTLKNTIKKYADNKMFYSTSITLPSGKGSRKIYVDYYYGPCLEEQNA